MPKQVCTFPNPHNNIVPTVQLVVGLIIAQARLGLKVVGLGLGVAHEGLVVADLCEGMLPEPAGTAEVLEAGRLSAEEGSGLGVAQGAQGVLQVRVDLDLDNRGGKEWSLYFTYALCHTSSNSISISLSV